MNRRLTALLAAFEALLVVAIGVAIPLLPLTLLWAFQYGLAIDWTVFWRASVDIWLLGHGVDVRLTLDPLAAAALGLPGAEAPVLVTIAPLGFALLTALLGVRAGRRTAEIGNRMLGAIVSLATFAALSSLVTFSALHPAARPSLWQGALLPTLVFAVGLTIGVCLQADDAGRRFRAWSQSWPQDSRLVAVTALRGGTAAAAAVVAVSAAATTAAIALAYARIITLYESLHGEVLGGIAITLGQLALLPNLVIWTASWLIGPGFAIGTGSLVSPLGTQLGPLAGASGARRAANRSIRLRLRGTRRAARRGLPRPAWCSASACQSVSAGGSAASPASPRASSAACCSACWPGRRPARRAPAVSRTSGPTPGRSASAPQSRSRRAACSACSRAAAAPPPPERPAARLVACSRSSC